MSDYDDRDYEVGKGKPPKETRWKKGQSGNPRGRPPAKRDARTMTATEIAGRLANEQIAATMNGKQIKLTRKEAALAAIFNDALSGDSLTRARAIKLLLDISAFNVPHVSRKSTDEERRKFLERLAQEAELFDPDYKNGTTSNHAWRRVTDD